MVFGSPHNLLQIVRRHDTSHPALIDATTGATLTYGDVISAAEAVSEYIGSRGRRLHFHMSGNTPGSVISYLGCLAAGVPVCLLDGAKSPAAHRIIAAYRPPALLAPPDADIPAEYKNSNVLPGGYALWECDFPNIPVHPDLAVLLTTSGSTGDPKLVRLTHANLTSNAMAIAEYLELGPEERSIQSLPMSYSYGLSLIHSHLVAGGTTFLTPHSFLRPDFWRHFAEYRCTSFAGVPHMYETLKRLRFDPGTHPTLRTMTQAGGKLGESLVQWMSEASVRTGKRFFVMYGQTEATARISYVPPDVLPQKIGSIGVAVPGGSLSLAAVEESTLDELVYSGPNVMMGYADGPESLTAGDCQGGVLRTGDLARVDEDGFYYITGRLKRFAKLFGKRVNLMDVESALESRYGMRAAAVDSGHDQLLLYFEVHDTVPAEEIAMTLSGNLAIPPNAIRIRCVAELPMTASGKKDYAAIARL
jgi:long-chain acyl-CoA synthetase